MKNYLFLIPFIFLACVNNQSKKHSVKISETVDNSTIPVDTIINNNSFELFRREFRDAVLAKKLSALENLVYFPFVDFHNDIYDLNSSLTSKTKDDFNKKYDEIFNECVIIAIKQNKFRGYDKNYGQFGDIISKDDFLLITGCKNREKDFLFKKINGKYYLYGIQYYE
jgi:hypothetical protein